MMTGTSYIKFVLLALSCFPLINCQGRSYNAVIEKIEVSDSNEYFKDIKIKVTKFNRTTTVANGTFEILKDLPTDIMASIVSFQKIGTQYKRSLNLKPVNLCDILKNEDKVYPDIVKVSNLPRECPFKKGVKYIKNFLVDEERLPQELPPGEYWRLDTILTHQSKNLVVAKLYVRVNHFPPNIAFGRPTAGTPVG